MAAAAEVLVRREVGLRKRWKEDQSQNILASMGKPSSELTLGKATLPAVSNWWQRRNRVLQFELLISSQLGSGKAEKAPPNPIRGALGGKDIKGALILSLLGFAIF